MDLPLIVLSLVASYLWISVPTLRPFSLQLTGGLLLLYLLAKRWGKQRWHHIWPTAETLETALLTSAVAVVVGGTGSLASPFLPLFHLILFMSVLTLSLPANLAKMAGLTVFLWATSSHPLTTTAWIELWSLPFLTPLMILARRQFEELRLEKQQVAWQDELLSQQETRALLFLTTYLKPKLRYIHQLLAIEAPENRWNAQQQLQQLEVEITQTVGEIDQATDSLDDSFVTPPTDSWADPLTDSPDGHREQELRPTTGHVTTFT